MKHQLFFIEPAVYLLLSIICFGNVLTGCQSAPESAPPETGSADTVERKLPDMFSDKIESSGRCSAEQLAAFFLSANPEYPADDIAEIAALYIAESRAENINSDIAFCQMCHETGYLKFGNLVTPAMNNFCGLGAISKEQRGCIFSDRQSGIRAHIQHLKAYGSTAPLAGECIDPRYRYVQPKGKSPSFYGLAKTWAQDPRYGEHLEEKLIRLYTVSGLLK